MAEGARCSRMTRRTTVSEAATDEVSAFAARSGGRWHPTQKQAMRGATWHPEANAANLLGMRLDKWLWAARFFKTRSLATAEVDAGHVELNGERAKPAKQLHVGDELRIRIHQSTYDIHVRGLSERRGPASEAHLLYEETEESQRERERLAEQRRLAPTPAYEEGGRPTKRDRRDMSRVKRRY